ncbi:cytochrome P450 [Xylariaceae sp. AK1471]|nr:cytochrome P450 [Xylariaceae sp. AK1471]
MDQLNDSIALPLATSGLSTTIVGKYGADVAQFIHNGSLNLVSYAWLLTWAWVTLLLISCTVFYVFSLVIYRLYLSPLAPFPGPFLAKITHWYEFYYNVIHTGKYYERIRDMHEKYGPVIRVTPEEIHVMEPSAYNKLFVTGAVRKTSSYPRFSSGTGFEDMTAISVSHDAHRRLRVPIDKLFMRSSIMRIESRVADRTARLCDRLSSYQGTGEVVNLTNALSSLTTDIISSVIFEEPSDYLGDPDFNSEWYETLKWGTQSVFMFKHLPWTIGVLGKPLLRSLKARREVLLIRKRPSDESKTRDQTTVLDHLVHSDLVERELGNGGFPRLAQLIQQAGSHNVSHTLGTIVTHLLMHPEKLEPLRKELEEIWKEFDGKSTAPSWSELEKAPYLSAVVAEGLRMAIGGMNRTPRVFPDDDVEICGWVIPKGTPVSMTTHWMHNDPNVFPEPDSFEPHRWLTTDGDKLKTMHMYFVPFARGSRTCVGQNLVYMQMFHTLSRLFRPGAPNISLHDTTLRDIIAVQYGPLHSPKPS